MQSVKKKHGENGLYSHISGGGLQGVSKKRGPFLKLV